MLTMELYEVVFLILVCGCAAFIQRVTGFGLGIFAMLFLPHFLPSHTAGAALVCLISSVTSGWNAFKYRKEIPLKTILPMLGASMVVIPIAVRFSAVVSARLLKSMLGIVLIVLSIYFLFFHERIRMKATIRNGILTGALSGALNALFGTGGPPAVLYLTQATTSNIAYFSGIQFYFAVNNVYSTGMRLLNGIINWEILFMAGIGLMGAVVGNMVGKRLFHKLNAKRLKQLIYIGMIISGILMIL